MKPSETLRNLEQSPSFNKCAGICNNIEQFEAKGA